MAALNAGGNGKRNPTRDTCRSHRIATSSDSARMATPVPLTVRTKRKVKGSVKKPTSTVPSFIVR